MIATVPPPAGYPPRSAAAPHCPRCRGNLFLDRDIGRPVWTCLQCARSFIATAPPRPESASHAA
jgi:hypothetical protein